jgi:hypothetical protein
MRRVARPQAAKPADKRTSRSRPRRRKSAPIPENFGPPRPPDCDCIEPLLSCNGHRVICWTCGSRLDLEPGRFLP